MSSDDTARSTAPSTGAGKAPKRRLGEILVAGGAVTPEQLAHALREQPARQLPLGQTLIALGYTSDEVMRQALSSQLGVPYIDLKNVIIDRTLAPLLDREFARQNVVFPVARVDRMLTIAMDDPTATHIVEDLAKQTGYDVAVVTSSHDGIHRALARMYEGTGRTGDSGAAQMPTAPAAPTRSGATLPVGAGHEYVSLIGLMTFELPDLLRSIEGGLAARTFDAFVASTGLTEERAAELADISPPTLEARRAEGRLSRAESDRLVRAARIVGAALALFKGDRTTAVAWLQSGQPMLGGATPIDLARTDLGAREVERALAHLQKTSAG